MTTLCRDLTDHSGNRTIEPTQLPRAFLPVYPATAELHLDLRPLLHPLLQPLTLGISEFTFANLYLFRHRHHYRLTVLEDGVLAVLGRERERPFFLLPLGLPAPEVLARLFADQEVLKCASTDQAGQLTTMGYRAIEDRDNFDYLYRRQDLAELGGRSYHKKRNLVKAFVSAHEYEARPLKEEFRGEALAVLDAWMAGAEQPGDYEAAREALEQMEPLQLCGGIYSVAGRPAAYVLGEELAGGTSFVIHFEKAAPGYKGLYQFINQSFAAILPEDYETINREQDLGDMGLRQAKLSYRPTGFVKKFRVYAK